MLEGNLATFDPENPAEGMYVGMPEEVYRSAKAWNWSVLRYAPDTMSKVKHAVDNPDDKTDTPDKLLGRCFDIVHLQPQFVDQFIAVQPLLYPSEKSTGRGRKKVTELVDKPWNNNATACKVWNTKQADAGKEILRQKELDRLTTMAASINTIPGVLQLVTEGIIQPCIFWRDGVPDRQKGTTGLMCKAKLDIYHDAGGLITIGDDKKVAKSAAHEPFSGHILGYKMHGQFAMYLDGINALLKLSGDKRRCQTLKVLVVEDHAPYDAAVYNIFDRDTGDSREWLQAGRLLWHGSLEKVAHCLRVDKWPGLNADNLDGITEPTELVPPEWASKRLETL